MPSRPSGQWGLLQLFYSASFGARWQNGIWYKPDSSIPGSFDVQVATDQIYTAAKTALRPLLNENTIIGGARFYVNNGVYTTSADKIATDAGLGVTGPIPPDDFIVVRSQANIAGRQGKGRILLSGIDAELQNGGRVDPSGDIAMATILAWLTASVSAGGVGWTAQQFDHVTGTLNLPAFWSYNPVLGNKKKRSPIL